MNSYRIFAKIISTFFVSAAILTIILVSFYFSDRIFLIIFVSIFCFYVINITIGLYILSSSYRNDRSKKTWLFVFLLLPIIGIIMFWFFGSRPFKERKINDIIDKRKMMLSLKDYTSYHNLNELDNNTLSDSQRIFKKIANYNYEMFRTPVLFGDDISIIEDPIKMLEESINLIRKAQKTIFMQYYIIEQGKWFNLIIDELVKKANQGIKVIIIYDPIGSINKIPKNIILYLKANNIIIEKFWSKPDYKFRSTANFRSHRKYLIIDNEYVLSGGSNIGDSYVNLDNKIVHWIDLNYKLNGGIAHNIALEFAHDLYYYTTYAKTKSFDTIIKELGINQHTQQHNLDNISINKQNMMTLIHSGPDQQTTVLNEVLLMLISNAKKSITIFTPYLFPTEEIIIAIKSAASSGVKVRLVLPGRTDSWSFTLSMNMLSYRTLLKSGIEIYEYSGFLHTKAILIDDYISILGSYNLDNRAIVINYESMLIIHSQQTNLQLNKLFLDYTKNSKQITFNEINNTKLSLRMYIQTIFINIFQPLL